MCMCFTSSAQMKQVENTFYTGSKNCCCKELYRLYSDKPRLVSLFGVLLDFACLDLGFAGELINNYAALGLTVLETPIATRYLVAN